MFKEIVFVLLVMFIAWVLIFQMILPYMTGTPFFPAFRSKLSEVENEIAAAREELAVDALRTELNTLKPPAPSAIQDHTEETK